MADEHAKMFIFKIHIGSIYLIMDCVNCGVKFPSQLLNLVKEIMNNVIEMIKGIV